MSDHHSLSCGRQGIRDFCLELNEVALLYHKANHLRGLTAEMVPLPPSTNFDATNILCMTGSGRVKLLPCE